MTNLNSYMKSLFLLFATFISLNALAQNSKEADAITGVWQSGSGKARIQIFKGNDDRFHGKIVWLREPNYEDGKPKVDRHNPDQSRKKVPIMGLQMLRNFQYEGDRVWVDGKIYDPEKGSDYSCKLTLESENTLHVRGFIGISLFGRTDTWKRITEKR